MEEIRKIIRKTIKEAVALDHVKRRFEDRFLSTRIMTVGLETGQGNYEEVGTYAIDDNLMNELKSRFELLTKKTFPKNKSYAVKLLDIVIDPSKINYFNPENIKAYQNKMIYKAPFILLNDSAHDSNGNAVYVIIRAGEIVTVMLAKNYVPISPQKMNVDFVIKDWNLVVQNRVR